MLFPRKNTTIYFIKVKVNVTPCEISDSVSCLKTSTLQELVFPKTFLPSGSNAIKLFTSVSYEYSKQARMFVARKPFQPGLMFVGNIRLGWKGLLWTVVNYRRRKYYNIGSLCLYQGNNWEICDRPCAKQ